MEIKIGDRIKFRSPTRWGDNVAIRKVNGFWGDTDMPTVRFGNYGNFAVRLDEVIEVYPN